MATRLLQKKRAITLAALACVLAESLLDWGEMSRNYI